MLKGLEGVGGGWRRLEEVGGLEEVGRFGEIRGCVCVGTHTYVSTCTIQASRSKGRGSCV